MTHDVLFLFFDVSNVEEKKHDLNYALLPETNCFATYLTHYLHLFDAFWWVWGHGQGGADNGRPDSQQQLDYDAALQAAMSGHVTPTVVAAMERELANSERGGAAPDYIARVQVESWRAHPFAPCSFLRAPASSGGDPAPNLGRSISASRS